MSERKRLPGKRHSISFNFEHEGFAYRATASRFDDGSLAEIFLDAGKINTPLQQNAETAAILVSLLLQHGVSETEILHSISGPIATALELAGKP
jgi:ribonucleoside-diphosphate reductase alpha chain